MKLKRLLMVEGLLSFGTGLLLTLLPGTTLGLYGLATNNSSIFMTQNAGGLYISLGLLALLASNSSDLSTRKIIVRIFLVSHLVLILVAIRSQTMDNFDFQLGWFSIFFELLFSAAFGYFARFEA